MRKYFAEGEIVAEKDAATYLRAVQQFSVDRNDPTVGNTRRSDINLAAGLHAVVVPHF
jgi:hypothetical protein